jgi:hypothetical protein
VLRVLERFIHEAMVLPTREYIRTLDAPRAVLSNEALRVRRIFEAGKLRRKAESVDGDKTCVVLALDMIAEVSLHIGVIKPP